MFGGGVFQAVEVAVTCAVTEVEGFGLAAEALGVASTAASATASALVEGAGAALALAVTEADALTVAAAAALTLAAAFVLAALVVVEGLGDGAPLSGALSQPSAAIPVASAKSPARESPLGAEKGAPSDSVAHRQNGHISAPART